MVGVAGLKKKQSHLHEMTYITTPKQEKIERNMREA